ncbi:hypothetical protein R1flu_006880 [Riccia fluitans]|uniref:Uncharacterized protein n=1 Tax=Riccia fluitans TaxID=41844 RepID=A0ABD1YX95_9MARC
MDQDQMVVSKFESLIKYNIKLDTWSTASRQLPSESENCQLHLGSLEDRVFMFRAKTDARLIAFGKSEDFSQLRQDPPTVIRLPRRFVTCGTSLSLCTFAATFRAFV